MVRSQESKQLGVCGYANVNTSSGRRYADGTFIHNRMLWSGLETEALHLLIGIKVVHLLVRTEAVSLLVGAGGFVYH